MMFKLPVISHYSKKFNGQVETIGNGGRVVKTSEEYREALYQLIVDDIRRGALGNAANSRAMEHFEEKKTSIKYQDLYLKWYEEGKS